jgi:hypothetical protein
VDIEELDIEALADGAMKLLQMETDELYTTLGAQLLAYALPTRTAGIVSYLSALRSTSKAKALYEALPEPALSEYTRGLGIIYDELKQDGLRHLSKIGQDLRKALCNQDILNLTDQVNRSTTRIIITIVEAALRMPRELDPVCVTIAAILLKQGLRHFCRQS